VRERLTDYPVTILLTDVEGSTALHSERGDARAQAILRTFDDLVRRSVRAHSGRSIKSLGDGVLAAFVSPRHAVACALAVQEAVTEHGLLHPDEQVRVRVALHTGEASLARGDIHGLAVSATARICAKAKGGEVLASEVVQKLCDPVAEATFRDRGRVTLRGFPQRWRLYQVSANPAAGARRRQRETPFVGRQAERAQLESLLEQAAAGHGGLVMLGGEPGVGKTRLTREIGVAARRRGFRVFTGHCYGAQLDRPYVAWAEIVEAALREIPPSSLLETLGDHAAEIARIVPEVRRRFPEIPPPVDLPAAEQRRYTFNSIGEYITRVGRRRPQLYILEDLHWADEATLLFLHHMVERLPAIPVVIIGTHRDPSTEDAPNLADALAGLIRSREAHLLTLDRHSQAEVGLMLRALSGHAAPEAVTAAIYAETDGNAFFVEEIFRHLADTGRLLDEQGGFRADLRIEEVDVPETLRLVLGRRLDRLAGDARRVLATAAVIGRVFDFGLLEALVDADSETLLATIEEAEHSGLVVSTSGPRGGLSFSHELIRQTLLTGLTRPRRQRLHLRVAEEMERTLGADADHHAAAIAHHLVEAGEAAAHPDRTVRYLCLAARRAVEAATFEDALWQLDIALTLAGSGDDRLRADLLVAEGTAKQGMGRWDESMSSWNAALDIHELRGDAEAVARLSADMSLQLGWSGRMVESLQLAGRGLSLCDERPSAVRAVLVAISGMAYGYSGAAGAGDQLTSQAVDVAEAAGDARTLAFALNTRANFHFFWSDPRRCVEVGERAAGMLRATGDLFTLAGHLGVMEMAMLFCGRVAESRAIDAEVGVLGHRLGHHGAELMHHHWQACDAIMAGDLQRLGRAATDDLEICRRHGLPWTPDSHVLLGLACFWGGDWAKALAHFDDGVLETLIPGAFDSAPPAFRLLTLAHMGDREGALEAVAQLRPRLSATGQPLTLGGQALVCALVRALPLLGQREEAAGLHPLLSDRLAAGVVVNSWDLALLHDVAGVAATAAERWQEAEQHFETALRQAEELPQRIAGADTRLHYGNMLAERRGAGDEALAHRLVSEAARSYRAMRMPRHRAMALTLLEGL
jgi:class 3 adenylate cyclase/tetratricopeptide (TPR) repeat protein